MAKYVGENALAELVSKIQTNTQTKLVSGTNIKTINNTSLLGSGNISISGTPTNVKIDGNSITSNNEADIKTINGNYNATSNKIATSNDLNGFLKSNDLKTINGTSIVGSGDITTYTPAKNEYSLSFQSSSNGTTTNIASGTAYQNYSDRPLLVILFYDADINSSLNAYNGFSLNVGSTSAHALSGIDNANNQTKYRVVRSATVNNANNITVQCIVPPKYYFAMACWGGSSTTANQSGQNLQARFLTL